ncbi:uncharacterized protein LOC106673741 isoform X2 [Cimex lectularius]|uniref:N-acetyltransferase domain-containing protein n=1 Tax=Cimex lectularius TaxID=79782 RepID=A0A8I6TLE4_CIMLE|nr:uncharacterized protein LOC106673741 isoform X2 [Cimex lectularius]
MYIIRQCVEDDIPFVHALLSTVIFKEEPLISINGPHTIPTVDESQSAAIIPQGHSFLAETFDGRIIGVCLNDEPPQIFPNIYTNTKEDVKMFFKYMEDTSKINELAPNALEIRLMAVCNDWRKRGVASSLLKASEEAGRNAGFSFVKVYCTSNYSSQLFEKLGWRKVFSLSYKEYDYYGITGLKVPCEPHTDCDLFMKKLF